MRSFLVGLFAVVGLLMPAEAKEVHGQTDAFKAPGVAMAWAVVRGADEARTFVVVRLRAAPGIDSVTVTGRDPFTKEEKVLQRGTFAKGRANVRIPRASFADFPRTDWQLAGVSKELPLTVFYLGVPDTTPEFASEAQLDRYLEERLAKLLQTIPQGIL
ncbi:MAG: hypothetical protein ABIR98_16415 [Usitatibacter sp.]